MEEIIARQNAAAKPATGKTFLLGIARIILELAAAQLVVNALIRISGFGLLNILFYLYAVVLLVRFMRKMVAGCIYMLRQDSLILQRLMGDSTVLGVEIALSDILSIRPIACGERLHLDYRQVTYVDMACAPGLRMRTAFVVSLFWAWLARRIAGAKAKRPNGYVVVYMENGKRCACTFRPDDAFAAALEKALPGVFGYDERMDNGPKETYWAKSLRRTFGDLYPHVTDVVSQEELAKEKEEFARRKEERIVWAAGKMKMTPEQYKDKLAQYQRDIDHKKENLGRTMASAGEKLSVLSPAKEKAADWIEKLAEEETEEAPRPQSGSSRRRRGRQE